MSPLSKSPLTKAVGLHLMAASTQQAEQCDVFCLFLVWLESTQCSFAHTLTFSRVNCVERDPGHITIKFTIN